MSQKLKFRIGFERNGEVWKLTYPPLWTIKKKYKILQPLKCCAPKCRARGKCPLCLPPLVLPLALSSIFQSYWFQIVRNQCRLSSNVLLWSIQGTFFHNHNQFFTVFYQYILKTKYSIGGESINQVYFIIYKVIADWLFSSFRIPALNLSL